MTNNTKRPMHASQKGQQSAKEFFKTLAEANRSISRPPRKATKRKLVHPGCSKRKKSYQCRVNCRDPGKPEVKRAKTRLKAEDTSPKFAMLCLLWLSLVTMLSLPLGVAGQRTVCDQDDWFYGYEPGAGITLQAAAFCPESDCDLMAAGGSTGTDAYIVVKSIASSTIVQELTLPAPSPDV